MAYTTVDLVSAELNGLSLTASTTPSSTTVESWIDEATSEINLRTGRVWESTVASSTLFDANGSRYFKFPQAPVISISTLECETAGLGADSTAWSTLTEGRTNDFVLYVTDGEIQFTGKRLVPSNGKQNLRVTYTYGYSTTPPYIQRLATALVASRVIETVINDSANEGGGSVSVGNISITDPSSFGVSRLRQLKEEVKECYGSVGDVYVYRPSRNYELR